MRREHSVSLEDHSAPWTDHRAGPQHQPRIRRIAVIRSDSQGFRIVSTPGGHAPAARPQGQGADGRQGRFGARARSRPSRRVRTPALAH
jgi:hypothetical protein